MSIEDVIRAWKSSEAELQPSLPASPVGNELSEEEMLEVIGGFIQYCNCSGNSPTDCGGATATDSCGVYTFRP